MMITVRSRVIEGRELLYCTAARSRDDVREASNEVAVSLHGLGDSRGIMLWQKPHCARSWA